MAKYRDKSQQELKIIAEERIKELMRLQTQIENTLIELRILRKQQELLKLRIGAVTHWIKPEPKVKKQDKEATINSLKDTTT